MLVPQAKDNRSEATIERKPTMNITQITDLSNPTTKVVVKAVRGAFGEKAGQITGVQWVDDGSNAVKVSTHVGDTEVEVEVVEVRNTGFRLTITTKDSQGETLSDTLGYHVKADEMQEIISKTYDTAWRVTLMRGLLKDRGYEVLPISDANTFTVYDQGRQNSAEVDVQPHKGIIDVGSENGRKFAQKVALAGSLRGMIILDEDYGAIFRDAL
jgi:hypothetical protein